MRGISERMRGVHPHMFSIMQHASLDEATQFLQVPQDGHIHAMVAWRDTNVLTLVSLWHIPDTEVAEFRKLFRKEVEIFDETQGIGGKSEPPQFESPLRIAKAAKDLSSSSEKQEWRKRTRLNSDEAVEAKGGA